MMDIRDLTIQSLRARLAARDVSAVEVCRAALARIETLADLNAFITVTGEAALDRAAQLDDLAQKGDELPPLAGAILGVKDNMVMRDVRTTAGSHFLFNYKPPYTATAIARLEQAGAIFVGKTNLDEFAMGSSSENSAYGAVKNQWNRDYVPGGSSGGSAVAVAAGMALAALGSDTGGSIRQPASLTGVVGLKPTYGRVSRYGLIAFGSSLDQIGPLAHRVADAAAVLNAIAGHDVNDSTSANQPADDYVAALAGEVKGLRVGVPREYYGEGLDDEVGAQVEAAIGKLKGLGAEIVDVSLPH